ncbi:hypothetical protein L596_000052 [Steinernema carpocapsae]|uniref:Uncharacterized protein n=1 Tax=Steinernema carpocapsae TaxID=34508 RepID=A0A4U8UH07_STECR|nr:hypothetical protein L596_000052 [Steinernema carpocapsae]
MHAKQSRSSQAIAIHLTIFLCSIHGPPVGGLCVCVFAKCVSVSACGLVMCSNGADFVAFVVLVVQTKRHALHNACESHMLSLPHCIQLDRVVLPLKRAQQIVSQAAD